MDTCQASREAWVSPASHTIQIDSIMPSKKNIVSDLTTLNSFSIGSGSFPCWAELKNGDIKVYQEDNN